MTERLVAMEPSLGVPVRVPDEALDPWFAAGLSPDEVALVGGLVRRAKDQGLALTGPGGPVEVVTKTVIETALTEELSDHLGYDKHDPVAGAGGRATSTVSPISSASSVTEKSAWAPVW